MNREEYQKRAGAVIGITMEALNSVGVETKSARELAAKKRLWSFIDREFKDNGNYALVEAVEAISVEFEDVLLAIDIEGGKLDMVLDTLTDELYRQFGGCDE